MILCFFRTWSITRCTKNLYFLVPSAECWQYRCQHHGSTYKFIPHWNNRKQLISVFLHQFWCFGKFYTSLFPSDKSTRRVKSFNPASTLDLKFPYEAFSISTFFFFWIKFLVTTALSFLVWKSWQLTCVLCIFLVLFYYNPCLKRDDITCHGPVTCVKNSTWCTLTRANFERRMSEKSRHAACGRSSFCRGELSFMTMAPLTDGGWFPTPSDNSPYSNSFLVDLSCLYTWGIASKEMNCFVPAQGSPRHQRCAQQNPGKGQQVANPGAAPAAKAIPIKYITHISCWVNPPSSPQVRLRESARSRFRVFLSILHYGDVMTTLQLAKLHSCPTGVTHHLSCVCGEWICFYGTVEMTQSSAQWLLNVQQWHRSGPLGFARTNDVQETIPFPFLPSLCSP